MLNEFKQIISDYDNHDDVEREPVQEESVQEDVNRSSDLEPEDDPDHDRDRFEEDLAEWEDDSDEY